VGISPFSGQTPAHLAQHTGPGGRSVEAAGRGAADHLFPILALGVTPQETLAAGLSASPICASAASAWGSHKVIAMARYSSVAVDSAARACCCWPVAVHTTSAQCCPAATTKIHPLWIRKTIARAGHRRPLMRLVDTRYIKRIGQTTDEQCGALPAQLLRRSPHCFWSLSCRDSKRQPHRY
jgi:hypothetical protein